MNFLKTFLNGRLSVYLVENSCNSLPSPLYHYHCCFSFVVVAESITPDWEQARLVKTLVPSNARSTKRAISTSSDRSEMRG